MDDSLLLHPSTRRRLEAFLASPANAVLIMGQLGAGKKAIARQLSAALLNIQTDNLHKQPYFFVLSRPEAKSDIPIDEVRGLIRKTSLKVAAGGQINRVALIEDAGYLSIEAQNALLKLLEEPPAATLLILTAASEDQLLPTIVSRVQRLTILPPKIEQSLKFFNNHPETEVRSAWQLARGGAALQSALLSDKEAHPLKQAVNDAKDFLKMDRYQRVLMLQQLAKDRQKTLVFLEALSRVLSALQADSVNKQRLQLSVKVLEARRAVERQQNYHEANVNSRVAGLALGLDISL